MVGSAKQGQPQKVNQKKALGHQKPKPNISSFRHFVKMRRDGVRRAHPNVSNEDVDSLLDGMWRGMDNSAKRRFDYLAAADKMRYDEELAAYEKIQERDDSKRSAERTGPQRTVVETKLRTTEQRLQTPQVRQGQMRHPRHVQLSTAETTASAPVATATCNSAIGADSMTKGVGTSVAANAGANSIEATSVRTSMKLSEDVTPWLPLDDQIIRSCVDAGVSEWSEIAKRIPGRTEDEIRMRWRDHLNPETWSKDEIQKLFELQKSFGSKWAMISKQMPHRTPDMCEKQFNWLFPSLASESVRKVKNGKRAPEMTTEDLYATSKSGSKRQKSKESAGNGKYAPETTTEDLHKKSRNGGKQETSNKSAGNGKRPHETTTGDSQSSCKSDWKERFSKTRGRKYWARPHPTKRGKFITSWDDPFEAERKRENEVSGASVTTTPSSVTPDTAMGVGEMVILERTAGGAKMSSQPATIQEFHGPSSATVVGITDRGIFRPGHQSSAQAVPQSLGAKRNPEKIDTRVAGCTRDQRTVATTPLGDAISDASSERRSIQSNRRLAMESSEKKPDALGDEQSPTLHRPKRTRGATTNDVKDSAFVEKDAVREMSEDSTPEEEDSAYPANTVAKEAMLAAQRRLANLDEMLREEDAGALFAAGAAEAVAGPDLSDPDGGAALDKEAFRPVELRSKTVIPTSRSPLNESPLDEAIRNEEVELGQKMFDEETLTCLVCSRTFKSADEALSHYTLPALGDVDSKQCRGLRKKFIAKARGTFCWICDEGFENSLDLAEHDKERRHEKLCRERDWSFHCRICKCDMGTIRHLESHMRGNRHRSGMKQLEKMESAPNHYEQTTIALAYGSRVVEGQCRRCDVHFSGFHTMWAHARGKRHAANGDRRQAANRDFRDDRTRDICRHYLRGGCRRPRCPYRHEEGPYESSEFSRPRERDYEARAVRRAFHTTMYSPRDHYSEENEGRMGDRWANM
jgi:hypothetical protein